MLYQLQTPAYATSTLLFHRTNPEAFRGRGVLKIVADEGFALYRGWGWTAARNAPGSFAVRQINSLRRNPMPHFVAIEPIGCAFDSCSEGQLSRKNTFSA